MPREPVAVAPRTPVLRDDEEPELGPRRIRIQTEFAAPKHGTEPVAYRNELSANAVQRVLGRRNPQTGQSGAYRIPAAH